MTIEIYTWELALLWMKLISIIRFYKVCNNTFGKYQIWSSKFEKKKFSSV